MDNPLTPERGQILIEDALHTYPMASMPRDVTAQVLARIKTMPESRAFRLTWNDVVLAAFVALCIAAIWFSVQNLPPIVIALIRKETLLAYQYLLVNARWLLPLISFSLAGFFAALTLPYLRRELTKNPL
jgi:hypothetical protein